MWARKLPVVIRQRLAGQNFNKDTYESLMDLADALYDTPSTPVVAAAAKSKATPQSPPNNSLDDTQPAIPYAVNAAQRGQRGSGRGGRNNRGGRGRGNNNRGGQQQQQPATKNQNQNQTTSRWPTPRHADGPPSNACFNHHTYGRLAYHCTDPLSCGWASIPPNPRQKPVSQ